MSFFFLLMAIATHTLTEDSDLWSDGNFDWGVRFIFWLKFRNVDEKTGGGESEKWQISYWASRRLYTAFDLAWALILSRMKIVA
ncbi:hypothetical protein HQ48_05260 [Porphyromonas sp. COT-290 OH3588]|nr:hypothetical protein HQ48_05260 [Porphyromonas sp. COT-290 OH3588]